MRRAHVGLLVVVVLAAAAAVVGAFRLWPPASSGAQASTVGDGVALREGTITQIAPGDAPGAEQLAPGARALQLTARLRDGRDVTFEMVDEAGDTFAVGQRVRIAEAEGPDGRSTFYVNDIHRERPLLILGGVFLLAVLLFGRWKGVRALLGLGITLAVVVGFMVPAVLAGRDPVLVALCAAVGIMVVTLYLTHGVGPPTTAAVVGTLLALAVTVGLSWLFIQLTALTGMADEARLASVSVGGMSLRGLLLAGIIVGALGVLDDVTMAQAATVFELRRVDPGAGFGDLYSGGMTVGRDHVAAAINTLFLAYAGASLPLLLLFSSSPDPLPVIASSELVAVELVRTLVGSIGLMASVPLTTALAAWLAVPRLDEVIASDRSAPPRRGRRRQVTAGPPAPARAPGPDPGDDVQDEWERRLRESYGLQRRPGRRPPVRE